MRFQLTVASHDGTDVAMSVGGNLQSTPDVLKFSKAQNSQKVAEKSVKKMEIDPLYLSISCPR